MSYTSINCIQLYGQQDQHRRITNKIPNTIKKLNSPSSEKISDQNKIRYLLDEIMRNQMK